MKMKKWQIVLIIIAILLIPFLLGLYNLGMFKFFAPKVENVRRNVFEQTQSYTHGKIQDLAKYYDEYNRMDVLGDKEAVRQLVILRFAEFDETKIRPQKLRNFLIDMRGY